MEGNKLIAGGISGLLEITATHPMHMIKTRLQQSNRVRNFSIRNLYTGYTPRIMGVVPMRCVYWSVMNECNQFFKSKTLPIFFLSGVITGAAQSCIDTPIEFLKIQAIAKIKVNHSIFRGFTSTVTRNMYFAGILKYFRYFGKPNLTIP